MREQEIIDAALERLRALVPDADISPRESPRSGPLTPDLTASLRMGSLEVLLLGEVFRGDSGTALRDRVEKLQLVREGSPGTLQVVVAPYLSPRRREMIRESGLGYLDLSGNAFLKHSSLYVYVESQTNSFTRESGSRGAFSGKGSLVVELLLEQPQRSWGIRELAGEAGLDPGHVSRVVSELVKDARAAKVAGKIQVRNPSDLLADWSDAYRPPRGMSLLRFAQVRDPAEIVDRMRSRSDECGERYALGNLAGAALVAPYASVDRVDIYVCDTAGQAEIEECLGLREVERGANVVLHVLADPEDAVIRRRRTLDGLSVVSDLRLYLDLRKYPRRGLEQAEHLLEAKIAPRWEST